MKSPFKSIKFSLIFAVFCIISCILNSNKSFSQGFNSNEWVFGYCGSGEQNNYLSFGKGGDPIVRSLPGSIVVGENNNAIAIDPISGQKLFYTNGELVYNYDDNIIQGAPNGIGGNIDGRQQVAIGILDYDPDGNKLYYTFHITPGGQLQYSVVDMNAAGGATGNQPPLGQVTVLNQNIGAATGAITVVKSAQSPSYLISFSAGNLISRRIEATQGDFTETDNIGIPFTPKAIIFNEDTGQLILIPQGPNDDLVLLDFDTNTGAFSNLSTISQSGGDDPIEGVAFSPDGNYIAHVITGVAYGGFFLFDHTTPGSLSLAATYPIQTVNNTGWGVNFSPDGNYIAVTHTQSSRFTLLDHTTPGSVSLASTYSLSSVSYSPVFSPDGNYIAIGSQGAPYFTLLDHTTPGSVSLAATYVLSSAFNLSVAFSPN
jgi:hypothetical protein